MAGEAVARPVDVIGRLPEAASASLAKMSDHSVSIMRLGAIVVSELDLMKVPAPTTLEVQASNDCAGIVAFFERAAIAEDLGAAKDCYDLLPLIRLFAEGLVMQHRRMVLYVGAFVDPTRMEAKWISLPTDMKQWWGGENAVEATAEDMREIEQRLAQTAWMRKFNSGT